MLAYVPIRAEQQTEGQPWGTIALFAANVGVALAIGCWAPLFGLFRGVGGARALLMPYDRFEPWTWITSAFVHRDFVHLAGNMAFLLCFGMVAERFLGWKKLVGAYFAIAFAAGAVEQALVWGQHGSSGGASGCIFGFMAMALVLAPRSRILMGYWVWRHVGTVWVSVKVVALWFLGLNLLAAFFSGFIISSSVLHVLGAGAGLALVLIGLNKGWFDAQGEDWFSLRRAEEERISDLPDDHDPLRHVIVPQYSNEDHVRSFAAFMVPATAFLTLGWGLVRVAMMAHEGLPTTLLLLAVGSGLVYYWRVN